MYIINHQPVIRIACENKINLWSIGVESRSPLFTDSILRLFEQLRATCHLNHSQLNINLSYISQRYDLWLRVPCKNKRYSQMMVS